MESFHTSYEAKLLLHINCFNGPLASGLSHVIRAWPPESGLIWSGAMSTLALWTLVRIRLTYSLPSGSESVLGKSYRGKSNFGPFFLQEGGAGGHF